MWPVICGGPMAPAQTCPMLAFYARYSPRLRGLSATERESALAVLKASLFGALETPPLSDLSPHTETRLLHRTGLQPGWRRVLP